MRFDISFIEIYRAVSKIKWKKFSLIYIDILCWLLLFPRYQASYSWYYQRKVDNRFSETYNATGPSASGDYLRSIKNAAFLRVLVQRETHWLNEKHHHIADPCATGDHFHSIQESMCNICRMARTVENKNFLT